MKQHIIWAIRPDALSKIMGVLRAPSTQLCTAVGTLLGRSLGPSELQAMLREDLASDGVLSADVEAMIAASEPAATTAGGVAVIPLRGIIRPRGSLLSLLFGGGGGLPSFRQALRDAVANEDVSSILLDVDSPGGLIDLVPETAAEIRDAAKVKPVRAIANTDAASAAYWLASQADEVLITPSGQVGSVGVFAVHQDWSKFDEQMGVATTLIAAGKFKTEANEFEPLSDEAREAIQADVDELYGMFVADVAKGRDTTAAKVRKGFGEGRMVLAKAAVQEGMADRIQSFEDVKARLTGGSRQGRRAARETEHAGRRALQLARQRH